MEPARRLKALMPRRFRRRLITGRIRFREMSASGRALPDVLIIGGQRCGTSSLYSHLAQHPLLRPSARKEVQYLTRYYGLGDRWYRAHFPLRKRLDLERLLLKHPILTFEATPDYLFHPLAPARAKATVPGARLIVLLRDPVDRALSHHRHMTRKGFEHLGFEEAIEREPERIGPDLDKLSSDPMHDPKDLLRYSYLSRGSYASQVEAWFAHFERERFLFIRSEDFFVDPGSVYRQALMFLGLPSWRPRRFRNYSYVGEPPERPRLDTVIHDQLRSRFREPNRRLYELIGRDMGWDR